MITVSFVLNEFLTSFDYIT